MSGDPEFSVEGARRAAERDDLITWVRRFLASPGSDNATLGVQLTEESKWWIGPLQLPIGELHRLAGPPGEPVLCPVDDDYWRDDVDQMADRIEDDGWEPPPVVVMYRNGTMVLEDGNHRTEGLRRAGEDTTWAVVGFEDAESRDRFETPRAPSH